jgi:uncharacterized protein YcbK (DUF882 family)
MMERRTLLRMGGAFAGTALAGLWTPAMAQILAAPQPRGLKFDSLHTGEKLAITYWADGRYEPAALAAINHQLRDYRTGDSHVIDPKLLDLLYAVNQKLETPAPFEVISGYRSPQTNAMLHERSSGVAAKSLHMQGMAIDIRVAGRGLPQLHDIALGLSRGGVGYYPTSDFVHVDVGRVRRWNGV